MIYSINDLAGVMVLLRRTVHQQIFGGEGKMKRSRFLPVTGILILVCILGAVCSSFASAEKALDENMTDGNYTISYPGNTMHGFSAVDYPWDMDIVLDVENEEKVALAIVFTGEADWEVWLKTGEYPDDMGKQEAMDRQSVDEPPTTPGVDAEVRYALYRSGDRERMKEVFIVDTEGIYDYVLVCMYPAGDEEHRDLLLSMVGTFEYDHEPGNSRPTNSRGSFRVVDSYDYDGQHTVVKDVVVNKSAQNIYWIFTETPVRKFRIERLTWNDKIFKVKKAKVLYSRKTLKTSEVIAVFDWLPEILPTVRFRAVNTDGKEEVWYVSTNEENGSIILLSEEEVMP